MTIQDYVDNFTSAVECENIHAAMKALIAYSDIMALNVLAYTEENGDVSLFNGEIGFTIDQRDHIRLIP